MSEPPVKEGDQLPLHIERLAYGGDGVARVNGFTVFVPRTAPEDRVEVNIQTVRKRYARGIVTKMIAPSSLRITPKCRHFDRCGGCHYQHIHAEYVARLKTSHVRESLERLGPGKLEVEEILQPRETWGYRNRTTYHRSSNAQGYVAWDRREILDIPECPITRPELNLAWNKVREILKEVSPDEIFFVVLRSTQNGQIGIIFSTTGSIDEKYMGRLRFLCAPLDKTISIFATTVPKDSYTPFGKDFLLVQGPEEFVEKVHDIQYHLRPDLFFQIHPEMTENVCRDVMFWAKDSGNRFLDLYCGAGLFSLALAKEGKSVLGVEMNHISVLAAQKSAKINQVDSRARFRVGKAETILKRLIQEKEDFDGAIVDPPRKGLKPEVIESLMKFSIQTLIYVSCSPPTMARDFKILAERGFHPERIQPYDMFPQTYHVETVSVLKRRDLRS